MGALPILFQTEGLSSKLDQMMKASKNHTQNRIQIVPFIYRDVRTVMPPGPLRVFQGKFTIWKTIFTAYKCAMSGFEDKIYNGGLFICVKPLYKCFAWRLPVVIQSWPGFSSALMTSYNNLLLNLSL